MGGIGLLIAMLLVQPLPAPGSVQWEGIGEGGTTYVFIDPSTIVRNGDIVNYTSRLTVAVPAGDGIAMFVLRHARNCRTSQTGFLGADAYNESGGLIGSRRTRPADVVYQDDITGPAAPLVHRRVCGAPAG